MAICMAIAALFFLWDPLFTWPTTTILAGGDIAAQFIPWQAFLFDSLRQYGELPLWNPYLFAGAPFAANPQPMVFYPFTYLGLLMPLTRAMALTLALHIWIAGMGMYGWLRSLGATHGGACLAGLAFAFSGTFSLRLGVGQYGVALQLAWWPLSFWMLHAAFERASWRRAALGGLPLAMGLLSGNASMVPLLYIALAASSAYEAWQSGQAAWDNSGGAGTDERRRAAWRAGGRVAGQALLAVVTSLALAAVQYLPLATFSLLSARAASPTLDFSARFSLPIAHLVTLLIPNFFGEVIQTGSWSVEGHQEITHYVGVLTLLLAAAGARLPHRRRLVFFLGLALAAVILQLGPEGSLFTFFYRFVPGFALTRGPGRAGLIYTFAIIIAAGLAWSEMERASLPDLKQALRPFGRTLLWTASTATVAAIALTFVVCAAFRTPEVAWTWHLGGQLTWFLILFWAAMALLAAWRGRWLSQGWINTLAAGLVLFDLYAYGLRSIRPGDDLLPSAWRDIAGLAQDSSQGRVAVDAFEFFYLNGALDQRLRSHAGYDPLVLARYKALLDSASDYFDCVYDLLNVRYVVTRQAIEFPEGVPTFALELDRADLKAYRRPDALPRAFVVHQAQVEPDDAQGLQALRAPDFDIRQTVVLAELPPCDLAASGTGQTETAHVVAESPNHLLLETTSESPGLLALSEVAYPGWRASVDGQPVQVLRADVSLRAICLPAGQHSVRFDFQPLDVLFGATVSGLTLCGLLVVAWFEALRPARRVG